MHDFWKSCISNSKKTPDDDVDFEALRLYETYILCKELHKMPSEIATMTIDEREFFLDILRIEYKNNNDMIEKKEHDQKVKDSFSRLRDKHGTNSNVRRPSKRWG